MSRQQQMAMISQIRNPTNEETMAMKIDSGSMIRTKSSPRTNAFRRMVSPPARAVGIRSSGKAAVTAPRAMAQADRADLDSRPTSGMVKEPTIGTKTVSRVIVSMFMVGFQTHPFAQGRAWVCPVRRRAPRPEPGSVARAALGNVRSDPSLLTLLKTYI